jgi:hypothetical protein
VSNRRLPLRADQIQPPDDPARAYAERAQAGMARAIGDAVAELERGIDEPTMAGLLGSNDFATLWDHLAIERLGEALRPALNRLAVIHDQVATAEMASIGAHPVSKARPSSLRTPDVIQLTYDPLDTRTVDAQRAAREAVIQRLEQSTERTAQQVVTQGLQQRRTPAQIARDLRVTIGMGEREAAAIQAYRRALEEGGTSSLSRSLRDPRYDKAVQRASDAGKPLDQARIDRMVQRYGERYRAYRANMTARTETLRAANEGRRDAWRQYDDRTRSSTEIRRFWLIAGDERTCPVCRSIPLLNTEGITLDGTYDSLDGPVDMPPIHPLCRCTENYVRALSYTRPVTTPAVGMRVLLY